MSFHSSTAPTAPERIRLLRIFSRLNVGGPSRHVILTTAGLDPTRYDSKLVVGREGESEGNFFSLAREKSVALEVLPPLGRNVHPLRDVAALLGLLRILRRERPHIVHTHTAKAGALGRLAARWCNVPLVIHTFHGSVFDGYFSPPVARLYTAVERALARITDVIVAVSPRVASDLRQLGVAPRHGIEVVYLGLELQPFRDAPLRCGELRSELGIEPDSPLVGCVGRLVPIKDVSTLLLAFRRLIASLPDAQLLVVGDGPERRRLEDATRALDLSGRVRFLGFRTDLIRIYSGLDLVVNSSRNEGTPVALIEAMASGVPVVATRVGGTADLLEEGRLGRLVPPGDPEALGRVMGEELSGSCRGESPTSRTARERVCERFRIERLLSDLDQLYRSLLRRRVGDPGGPARPPWASPVIEPGREPTTGR